MRSEPRAIRKLLRQPLFRLLAINLAAGVLVAALLLGGLLWLNPLRLRELIFADDSPGTALGLLLFGFVITFGSAAMGTAIMAMGQDRSGGGDGGRRQTTASGLLPARVPVREPTRRERASHGRHHQREVTSITA
jgi:hypothetical protein